ncbi:MAG: hypothetical protein Q4D35_05200 [Ruminococcus sp.]|nr:hypothetical protein [Ruminococcus sp.]
MDNVINKRKLILHALLRVLEAEFFGLFVVLFFWALTVALGVVANILFGIVGIVMLACIMADYGLKKGEECKNKVTLHGAEPCRNFGFTMGLVAMCPSYILLGLLSLSKAGVFGNFLTPYKLLNSCFFPFIDLAAPTTSFSDVSPALYIMMAVLPVFYLLSLGISFRLGYDAVDLKEKLIYKNSK